MPPSRQKPAAPPQMRPVPFRACADQLVARGIVPAEKANELARFMAALQALDRILGPGTPGPRAPREGDQHGEFQRAVVQTERTGSDLLENLASVLDRLDAEAVAHVAELLKADQPRFARFEEQHDAARRTLNEAREWIGSLGQKARIVTGALRDSQLLFEEVDSLRRELNS